MVVRTQAVLLLILLSSLLFSLTTVAQEDIDLTVPLDSTLIDDTYPVMASTAATFFDSPAIITFSLLGFEDPVRLVSPLADASFTFGLPDEWQIQQGLSLQLGLNAFEDNIVDLQTGTAIQTSGSFQGTLDLAFNDIELEPIVVDWTGQQTVNIEIPAEALITERLDGRHQLRLSYESRYECGSNLQSGLVISPQSFVFVPFTQRTVSTDLRLLPYPLSQRSFLPDIALLIVPDDPTIAELQAAITTAAGLGKISDNRIQLALLTNEQLTDEIRASEHLIFIGKPGNFPMLSDVDLSLEPVEDAFLIDQAQQESGILQMAPSPWNDAKAILWISGNTDEGVIKASRAVSTGQIRTNDSPNIAFVERIQGQPQSTVFQSESTLITLESLGYDTVTVSGDRQTSRFYFSLNDIQNISPNSTFNLFYGHSSLLDYEQSSISLRLNERPFGSIEFSADSTNLFNAQQVTIPRSALKVGENELRVDTQIAPLDPCMPDRNTLIWSTIHAESYLELLPLELNPLQPTPLPRSTQLDLRGYPEVLSVDFEMANTVFVISRNDTNSWSSAVRIASDLGDQAQGSVIRLSAIWGDESPPESMLEDSQFIVVGQPTTNSFVEEISSLLPVPFEEGRNLLDEDALPAAYEYDTDRSIGYLQIMPSPWNTSRALFVIAGSTTQGLRWAADALITDLQFQLSGNVAIVDEQIVTSYDLRRRQNQVNLLVPFPTPEAGEGDFFPIPPELTLNLENSTEANRPSWLLPAIAGSAGLFGLILLGVIIFYAVRFVRRARSKESA